MRSDRNILIPGSEIPICPANCLRFIRIGKIPLQRNFLREGTFAFFRIDVIEDHGNMIRGAMAMEHEGCRKEAR